VFTALEAVRRHLSPRRPGFDPRPLLVRFVVDRVALEQGFFFRVLPFSHVSITQPLRHTHPHMHVAVNQEDERANPGTLLKKAAPFRKSESVGHECTFTYPVYG